MVAHYISSQQNRKRNQTDVYTLTSFFLLCLKSCGSLSRDKLFQGSKGRNEVYSPNRAVGFPSPVEQSSRSKHFLPALHL